jgi:rhodanese-related sulfurtransferase
MKHFIWLLLLLAGARCRQNTAPAAPALLDPAAFERTLHEKTDAILIDVRTPQEYGTGFIAGARNIDISDSGFEVQIEKLDKSRPVMVYCAKGGRSASAAGQLKRAGFPEVYDLDGGMEAWRAAGKPVDR